jgi:hypothetical protein
MDRATVSRFSTKLHFEFEQIDDMSDAIAWPIQGPFVDERFAALPRSASGSFRTRLRA